MLTALVYVAGAIAAASILAATAVAAVILSGRRTPTGDLEAMVAATREPPAAGNAAAPVPRPAVPQQPAPPPGHRPTPDTPRPDGRCALCGWHRVYTPCCGWRWVPEICPAHQTRRTTP